MAHFLTATDTVLHHGLETLAHVGGPAGFFAAKAGYYVPVGSLAYLTVSSVVTPFATIRAARKKVQSMLKGEKGSSHHKSLKAYDNKELIAALLQRFNQLDDQSSDQYTAYLFAALDESHGDLRQSIDLADQCMTGSGMKGQVRSLEGQWVSDDGRSSLVFDSTGKWFCTTRGQDSLRGTWVAGNQTLKISIDGPQKQVINCRYKIDGDNLILQHEDGRTDRYSLFQSP